MTAVRRFCGRILPESVEIVTKTGCTTLYKALRHLKTFAPVKVDNYLKISEKECLHGNDHTITSSVKQYC